MSMNRSIYVVVSLFIIVTAGCVVPPKGASNINVKKSYAYHERMRETDNDLVPITPTLDSFQTRYEGDIKKIEEDQTKKLDGDRRYIATLDYVIRRFKDKEDFEGTVAAKKEKDRFKKERTVPKESPKDLPSVIEDYQTSYRAFIEGGEREKREEIRLRSKIYLANLKALHKQLLHKEEMAEGEKVNAEVKRLELIVAVVVEKDHVCSPHDFADAIKARRKEIKQLLKESFYVKSIGGLHASLTNTLNSIDTLRDNKDLYSLMASLVQASKYKGSQKYNPLIQDDVVTEILLAALHHPDSDVSRLVISSRSSRLLIG